MFETPDFFDCVGSTQDVAKSYPVGSVIVARRQEQGRGRMGRTWVSEPGNLFFSVVLPEYDKPYLYGFAASLAIADALASYSPRLKWPNDVLLQNKKVCGLLLEHADEKVILGIGVNIVSSPKKNMLYETVCLKDVGPVPTVEQLLSVCLACLEKNIQQLMDMGFGPVRRRWLEYATGIGQHIRVALPNETLEGEFEGLSEDGFLRLRLPTGQIKVIMAGDVNPALKEK
ncbi:MAG: biotin--[acetyl-CoA-carboxylase] ligase [Alphaproteobacteria bacterium]|nr:biotin--[acetyl-CoA-carboxylase] ligase [Alphaproteobacteria bacterium]